MSLKVVALESPYVASEGPPGDRLRIGPTAEVEGRSRAVVGQNRQVEALSFRSFKAF